MRGKMVSCVLLLVVVANFCWTGPVWGEEGVNSSEHLQPEGLGCVLLWEILPYAYGDSETVVLKNICNRSINLSGWSITDNEGRRWFSNLSLGPDEEVVIAEQAGPYENLTGRKPNLTYDDRNWDRKEGFFKLADDADEVLLLDPFNRTSDAFIYGKSVWEGDGWSGEPVAKRSRGEVHSRGLPRVYEGGDVKRGWQDTNTSRDWSSPIRKVLGSTDLGPGFFHGADATFFLMPDAGRSILEEALASSEESISVCVYELADPGIASLLTECVNRGVEVRVLLEGSPVGGMSDESVFCADMLLDAGAKVKVTGGSFEYNWQKRFNFIHSKYLVIDHSSFLLMSENLKSSGFPEEGKVGNRGWGAWVHSEDGAGFLSTLFQEDWRAYDSLDYQYDGTSSLFETTPFNWSRKPLETMSDANFAGEIYATPDCTLDQDPVLRVIENTTESLLVQQFYIYTYWGSKGDGVEESPNPYLEAVIDAAERGVRVRVVMDNTYYNREYNDPRDNDDTMEYINGLAGKKGWDMQAKLISDVHGFSKVHNKGLVADNDTVVISSINWNENSPCCNRETALVVHSTVAGEYFASAFWRDWLDDLADPVAVINSPSECRSRDTVLFSARESFDDTGIVNYSWDMDADGDWDAFGKDVYWRFEEAGEQRVSLRVYDAYGNHTTAEKMLLVKDGEGWEISIWWILGGMMLVLAVAGVAIARRG